jgi:hypothetical protein
MSTRFPHIPWPDPNFSKNQSRFPVEELWKYAGQHVAWSWDGTRILASAPSDEELYQKLVEEGLDPQRVAFGYVDPPDIAFLGGLFDLGSRINPRYPRA